MNYKKVTLICKNGNSPSERQIDSMIEMLDKNFESSDVRWNGKEFYDWDYYPQSDNFRFIIYRGVDNGIT